MTDETVVECIEETSADLANLDRVPLFQLPDVRLRLSAPDEEEASRIHDLELLAGVER